MKYCHKCKKFLDILEFGIDRSKIDNLSSSCKLHKRLSSNAWRKRNLDRANKNDKNKYLANRKERIQKAKLWKENNPEKAKQIYKSYRQRNPGLRAAQVAKRRASKLHATPKWLSKEQLEQIKEFYKNCYKGYHVDHIIPLQGKDISGLHVPWNLQIIPAKENLKKGNKSA